MKKEAPPVLDDNLNDELMGIVEKERKDVRREKFDLSSTRVVLGQLIRDGLIKPDDKLSDVLAVIEDQFKRLEDI